MKRDMDLIRSILAAVEAHDGIKTFETPVEIYHVAIAEEGGLLKAEIVTGPHGRMKSAFVHRLTWAGHDFHDATKNEGLWKRIREQIIKPGAAFTFSVVIEVAKAEAQRNLRSTLGLPP